MIVVLMVLLVFGESSQRLTLHVLENGFGDCLSSPCNYSTATLRLETESTVIFEDTDISVTPSLTNLFETAILKNVSLIGKEETVISGNGRMPLFTIGSSSSFLWGRLKRFKFSGFDSAVIVRTSTETIWPLIIFENCSFENNTQDVINVKGGTIEINNCLFKNNSHRPFKMMSGTMIEITNSTIRDCNSSFFYDCDLIIRNSRFINNFGSRGGAFYVSKVTFLIESTKFINNTARSLGGAIYISETKSDFRSEIRKSCFIGNQANINGTSLSSYFSETLFRDNCFSDSESISIFGSESNNIKIENIFDSKCESCLEYEITENPFDPFEQEVDIQLNIEL
jgi:predicted outer membrane repeat protein